MSNTKRLGMLSTMMAVAAASAGQSIYTLGHYREERGGANKDGDEKYLSAKKVKSCAHCGNGHFHNNRFCSAECCKIFTAEAKAVRKESKV